MSTLAMDRDLAPEPPRERPRGRSLAWTMAVSLLLPAAFMLLPFADGAPQFTQLQVDGEFLHVEPAAVRAVLAEPLRQDFWNVDLVQARAAVEQLPWVARARVERAWPDTLRVRVWERSATARWSEGQLLDTEARVFSPPSADIDPLLPQLDGVAGQERVVLDTFARLQQRLTRSPFELSGLRQDARGEWFARCIGGIELHLGQGAPDTRVELLTGPVLEALQHRLPEVEYVDLRYTNGFSVGWRQGQVEEQING